MRVLRLPEFAKWISKLSAKDRAQVDIRLLRIEENDHFGDAKYLGDAVAELRWKSGMRLYFSKLVDANGHAVLALLGGTNHGQDKDIEKARVLLRRYADRAP